MGEVTAASGVFLTVVGSTMIDQIAYVARVPERGETVLGERFVQGFGGKGANQAVMARLHGRPGGDGQRARRRRLRRARRSPTSSGHGIDTTHVRRVPVRAAWRPSGSSRTAATASSSSRAPTRGLLPEHAARRPWPPRSAWMSSSASSRSTRRSPPPRSQAAREPGRRHHPQPGARRGHRPASSRRSSDWIIPNEHELAIIARAARAARRRGDPSALAARGGAPRHRLLVTLGERGAALVGD